MSDMENQELEIDLFELFDEFKKNISVILAITAIFAAAAGIYVYFISAPMYSYTKIIDSAELNDKERSSFATIFQNDAGGSSKGALASVEFIRDKKNLPTNLIKFDFRGSDPEYLTKFADEYMANALKIINTRIQESNEVKFNNNYFTTVKQEITNIETSLQSGVVSSEGAVHYLNLLKERLELMESNKLATFIKATIVEQKENKPQQISRKSLIPKSALVGLCLSLAYITICYVRKISK